MAIDKISVSLPSELLDEIGLRDDGEGRSGTIANCLSRYFAALQMARRGLSKLLSDDEVSLILDVLNGVAFHDQYGYQMIFAEVADGIELNKLDKKWKVNGKSLVAKVQGLNFCESVALADASERWWKRVGDGENPETNEALK